MLTTPTLSMRSFFSHFIHVVQSTEMSLWLLLHCLPVVFASLLRPTSMSFIQSKPVTQIFSAPVLSNVLLPSSWFVISLCLLLSFIYRNGYVDVYDYIAQTRIQNYQVAKEMYSAALLCNGKMLVCGDKEHLYFTEVETGKRVNLWEVIQSRLEFIVIFIAMWSIPCFHILCIQQYLPLDLKMDL